MSASDIKQLENQIKRASAAIESIKKANALFKKLSPAQKRVHIAKDVIAQLKSKKYKARAGDYLKINLTKETLPQSESEQLICSLSDKNVTCECCARSAIFASAVRNFNSVKISDVDTSSDGLSNIHYNEEIILEGYETERVEKEYFSPNQLVLIESCFEQNVLNNFNVKETDSFFEDVCAAAEYGNSFKSPEKRMIEIMNNIIENDGEFVIPDKFYVNTEE